jgi:hypothetical protein
MAERTPGGLFRVDPETRAQVLAPIARPPAARMRGVPSFSTGRRINVKLANEYFVTDPEAWLVHLDQPAMLLLKVEPTVDALIPILEEAARTARPIAVGAPRLSDDVVAFLVVNKLRGILHCAAFEADEDILDGIASFAGGAHALGEIAHRKLDELPRPAVVVLAPNAISIKP